MPNRKFAVQKGKAPVLRVRPPVRPSVAADGPPTANERFKETFTPAFRFGVVAAVVAHMALIVAFPSLRAVELPVASPRLAAVDIPPRVSIPAPPRPVARPARPVIAAPSVATTLTIEPTDLDTFEQVSGSELGPPPVIATPAEDRRPPYIPYEVAPTLRNRQVAAALLEQVYPDALRDAGVSGSVQLWIHIDEAGAVTESRVARTSGYEELDIAATTVAYAMEFTPALMRDKPAAVWIELPIEFVSRPHER